MALQHDYIPQGDAAFDDWQKNFILVATPKLAAWGIAVANVEWVAVTTKQGLWTPTYAAGKKSVNPTSPQVKTKQDEKKAFEKAIRKFYKADIAFNPLVTPTDRVSLKTTVYDDTRTVPAPPEHAPVGFVQGILVGAHELRVTDPEMPDTKRFPTGLVVNLYRFIGTAVDSSSHFEQIATIKNSDFEVINDAANIGKVAFYYVQYENSRHEKSPASAIFSAAIA